MDLRERFKQVRADSKRFCEPLEVEDYCLQAMANTSPPKWHLAHTSWFFETFVLKTFARDYQPFHPAFEVLFNSYYNGIGAQHPRPERGLLSRPVLSEVLAYRQHVDQQVEQMLDANDHPQYARIAELVELGTHHEQQHQELFFTDIKYSLARNPLYPAYSGEPAPGGGASRPLTWLEHPGGTVDVGHRGEGFCFDNELPAHPVLLQAFALADRLVTCGEYLAFIDDAGYQRPELWLSDGWQQVCEQDWRAPLYWLGEGRDWQEYTLYGLLPLDLERPVAHVNAYEADAYARWAEARLPSEFEWEAVASGHELQGQFADSGDWRPAVATAKEDTQLHGGLWEWTSSAYSPYPGYQAAEGAVGEYNGKFMANQLVLRGGSCVSSRSQLRNSYRNFFYPPDRWQFSGIRLAQWR
ncbi:MAG: ergothioneine biosynthesis protein EgtB [Marinobacter sp.]|uniref:ergothioneine biosynthesis protein EgtB n=1 Tax=Marinobacter sp. TaxID=50741 RepID=UPI003297924B